MKTQVHDLTENYEKLIQAIVVTACNDYRKALKNLQKNTDNTSALQDKEEVERFLQSKWFGELTTIDGEMLIKKLTKEVHER